MTIDIQRTEREHARWLILATLNAARPVGAPETLVLQCLQDVPLNMTGAQLRRELDYLESRELITVEKKTIGVWHVKLTRLGVDVCEYTVDCEAGIARPEKYW